MFLRNLRVTLIAAITVPVVLAATVLLLSVLGMSFNIMTLGGMAAAVGLIIDDAIVMVEHVMRRMRARRGPLPQPRLDGGGRVHPAAGGIVGLDDHHLRAAGVSHRRDGGLLQGRSR